MLRGVEDCRGGVKVKIEVMWLVRRNFSVRLDAGDEYDDAEEEMDCDKEGR